MTGERVTGERMLARARAKNDEAATEAASARSMPTAVIAAVRAIAQAHAAFARAAFGAVLFADSGIESQRGNRPNNKTEHSNCRNELAHRCLPSRMPRHPPWLPPAAISTAKAGVAKCKKRAIHFGRGRAALARIAQRVRTIDERKRPPTEAACYPYCYNAGHDRGRFAQFCPFGSRCAPCWRARRILPRPPQAASSRTARYSYGRRFIHGGISCCRLAQPMNAFVVSD
jgi:hypothetical protein